MSPSKVEILVLLLVVTSFPGCVTGEDTPKDGGTISGEVSVANNDTVEHSLSITITESEGILKGTVLSENVSVGAGASETIDVSFEEGSYDVVVRTDGQLVSRYNWDVNDPPNAPVSDHLAVIHRGDRLKVGQRLEPRGITIQNRGNTSRRFDISVVDTDGEKEILSRNIPIDAESEYEVGNVTSIEGVYNITVRTDDGLRHDYSWEVRRLHHGALIVHSGEELGIAGSVQ